jgi:septal ring factor EnvC (AmiA/AmiB activator)
LVCFARLPLSPALRVPEGSLLSVVSSNTEIVIHTMTSHKRVDSAIISAPTNMNDTTKLDFSTQIQPVQAFFDSARRLIDQDGSSLLQVLLDKVEQLERELKEKDTILDGCKLFNKQLNAANQSLEALEKANATKFSDMAKQCEALRLANTENGKKLETLMSEKQKLESKLGNVQRLLKGEAETTEKLRDTLKEKNDTLATRAVEVEQLQKSEQSLNKRYKRAEQDLSQIERLTTKLQDEDQGEMLVSDHNH